MQIMGGWKNLALSQTTYAEAMKAMAASEEAVLESRNNFERTLGQCRIADRDLESRQEESVWLHRKFKYLFSVSEQTRTSNERLPCPGGAPLGGVLSATVSVDPTQVDQMCIQVGFACGLTGDVDRERKAKLEFLKHERNDLEARLQVAISMENSADEIAQKCRAENLVARKTTIDRQEKFHAVWERVTMAEAGLRRLQYADFPSCSGHMSSLGPSRGSGDDDA